MHGETRMTNRAGKGVALARRPLSTGHVADSKRQKIVQLLHLLKLTLLRMAVQAQFLVTGLEAERPFCHWAYPRGDEQHQTETCTTTVVTGSAWTFLNQYMNPFGI